MIHASKWIRDPSAFVLAAALLLAASAARGSTVLEDRVSALAFRFIGPDGNRSIAVVGVPGDDQIIYVGAASGGIFRTVDAGLNWEPIFDTQAVSSIGSLAIARSDPNVIWAGTGETFLIRPAVSLGDGIYKSTDRGDSWQHMGLESSGRIGRIVVHPEDERIVLACALGHAYGPQNERGIYRTEDGGGTWRQVLFVDERTGCSDLALDPTNPRFVYAGMWQIQIDPWSLGSGGPGSGVYRSRDGGREWESLAGRGDLPGGVDHPLGKVGVAVAASDPKRVYALVEDQSPGFYASDDRGESWTLVSQNHTLNERPSYYTRFAVAPDDEERIYFTSVRFSMSLDGGTTIVEDPPDGGGDAHDIWIDPVDPDRYMVADDGGVTVTSNGGRSFKRHVLPVAQMYHVAVDDRVPYDVYGNRQDGYSYRGPSNSRTGSIPLGLWRDFGGCESGWGLPVPTNPDIVWSGCYDGGLERFDARTGHVRSVRVWPEASYGWKPEDVKNRWHWSFPLAFSPHENETVYAGSQYVHRSRDAGQSWERISSDLTLNDPEHQQDSGGLTTDNLFTFDAAVLYAIAESPLRPLLIWAGSVDGQVHQTRDGGARWTNVTSAIPGLPAMGQVMNIEPSRFSESAAYVSVSRHQMADFDPYVFKTDDYGQSWKRIDSGIPRSMLSFVHVVREDPVRSGMLYVGTDNALYVSLDDGHEWTRLQSGLPPAPVYWLTVQERFHDLVVATYGRGFYVLDDITPLRALDVAERSERAFFFEPREAYRFQQVTGIKTGGFGSPAGGSHVTGADPEYGAFLHYWLAEAPAEDAPVSVRITDLEGGLVRTLEPSAEAGLNRLIWDLRYDPPLTPVLRNPPPDHDWVSLDHEGERPLVTWDLDLYRGLQGALAPPGEYRLTLAIGEHTFERTVAVLKDPNSEGTVADIDAQVALSLRLQERIEEVVGLIESLEWMRRQLRELARMLMEHPDAAAAAEELRLRVLEVEAALFDLALTGAREDAFRGPMRLYGRLAALASDVGGRSADYAPTDSQLEVARVLEQRLAAAQARYAELLAGPVERFDERLREVALPEFVLRGQDRSGH